ncbi:dTMP kinase [Microbacterium allomyrinae]|jgi:dTMP kinase|uniref:Thymidylate kinase n=1 Tax=Microbacterium allomyrinae TaxID=2830666 RepID=A0A9X1LWX4_9MICO|nr:dTMP kinase [Microbacterium allomyrinae]MCC2033216.1 dTMP kinase [Microbacterium allomyrinae]
MTRGRLIAVCGIDGSGKTTQIDRLVGHLRDRGHEVVATRQPTDRYRQDATVRAALDLQLDFARIAPELALFAAFDRLRHVREVIEPALQSGHWVVTDRYVYSTYAYFASRGIDDVEWLRALNRHAPTPDLTLVIDVPPVLAAERIIRRDGSSRKREELDLERMTSVRQVFLSQPWGASAAYHVLDGSQPADVVWAGVESLVDGGLN